MSNSIVMPQDDKVVVLAIVVVEVVVAALDPQLGTLAAQSQV